MYKTGNYYAHKFNIEGDDKIFYSKEKNKTAAWVDICGQMERFSANRYEQKNSFRLLAERMIEHQEKTVGYSTLVGYKNCLLHLKAFDDMNIQDIKPIDVQRLLDDMSRKKYSYSLISKTKITFGLVLKYAIVYEGLALNDYMSVIKVPKNTTKGKVTAPGDDVIDRILASYNLDFGLFAISLLCTGFRRGELNAIRRKDVDFENMCISVNHSVEFVGNQPVLKDTPKTESGIRKQPILNMYLPHLKKLCEGLNPDDFLFGGEKPLTKTQLRKRWDKYIREIGCDIKCHQLRHAYASLLYRAGYDPKTMQALLGHANFQTTMNIYTDFSKEVENKKMDSFNQFMHEKFANAGL